MRIVMAGTGHRPKKLGGYGDDVFDLLTDLALEMISKINPDTVISGMALGWDQALAVAATRSRVPLVAAVPFEGQESTWPLPSQKRYARILGIADEVKIVCEGGYAAWKMQKRNEWMVDECDKLLALWDGGPGGTGNCVGYAERKGKPMVNCWERWSRMRGEAEQGLVLPGDE